MPEHIKVELDFVPVEERLPSIGRTVFVRYSEWGGWPCRGYLSSEGYWRREDAVSLAFVHVTHWAEIPEIGT